LLLSLCCRRLCVVAVFVLSPLLIRRFAFILVLNQRRTNKGMELGAAIGAISQFHSYLFCYLFYLRCSYASSQASSYLAPPPHLLLLLAPLPIPARQQPWHCTATKKTTTTTPVPCSDGDDGGGVRAVQSWQRRHRHLCHARAARRRRRHMQQQKNDACAVQGHDDDDDGSARSAFAVSKSCR
jgi:hypothetical protein